MDADVFENGENDHRKRFFSKAISRGEVFENAGISISCGRAKTEFFEYSAVTDDTGHAL